MHKSNVQHKECIISTTESLFFLAPITTFPLFPKTNTILTSKTRSVLPVSELYTTGVTGCVFLCLLSFSTWYEIHQMSWRFMGIHLQRQIPFPTPMLTASWVVVSSGQPWIMCSWTFLLVSSGSYVHTFLLGWYHSEWNYWVRGFIYIQP